jgi:hypothetical protein
LFRRPMQSEHQIMTYNLFTSGEKPAESLETLGFNPDRGNVHLARTIMLDELQALLSYVKIEEATIQSYKEAILLDNCLSKRSAKSRTLTYHHLKELYILAPRVPLFAALLYFWLRDPKAQPLLALLLAATRDPFIRLTAPLINKLPPGGRLRREAMEDFIASHFPDRYSPAMLRSLAQNINSTWTKTGHLSGRAIKIRSQAQVSAASVAYALYIGNLLGLRGPLLLESEYVKMLDASRETVISLAEEASAKGWMIFKRIGDVIEVNFPQLTQQIS